MVPVLVLDTLKELKNSSEKMVIRIINLVFRPDECTAVSSVGVVFVLAPLPGVLLKCLAAW